MKKTRLLCISALLVLILSACGNGQSATTEGGDTSPPVTEDIAQSTTVTAEEPVAPAAVLVEDGKSNYIVITDSAASAEVTAVTRNFISRLETMSGVKLKLYPASYSKTDYEIVVGVVPGRETSLAQARQLNYTGWSLVQEGNRLFVTAHTEGGVLMALNELMGHIQEVDGRFVVMGDVTAAGQTATGKVHNVPSCVAQNARVEGIYPCGNESIEICLRGITKSEYTAYDKTLTEAGYTKYTENKMGNCLFATYTGESNTIHLGFYPNLQNGTLRIISEPTGYLPATSAPAYTRMADTTFTQIKRQAADINAAPGMSYIMQLADGSFIIIDGGPANDTDEKALFDYLSALTPAGQKPTIAAWFITHAHSDHMALANNFLATYHAQIEVKMAAYNFPKYEEVKDAKDVLGDKNRYQPMIDTFIGNIRKYWPQADHFVYHAGQKLYLADAEIEIFFTHEDQYPGEFTYINHTSSAFRITAGGKTVMILGDCEKPLCNQMASTFGSYLKSDMLQLSHHGFNGATLSLYQAIDPDICFWACSKNKFETDGRNLGTTAGYDFNAYLRDETIKKRTHYHSSETTVIPMS